MVQYTVTVLVDPSWVDTFNEGGFFLVVAKAMSDPLGKTNTFNVVAQTYGVSGSVTPTMTITWEDNYEVAGTEQLFKQGDTVITGSGPTLAITYGQGYNLTSWTDASVEPDAKAPSGGFDFNNEIPASSLVSLLANDTFVPVYISPTRLPPGTQSLVPKEILALWFSNGPLVSGSMVTVDQSKVGQIDLTGNTSGTIDYNAKGIWVVQTSKPIDYTKDDPTAPT